MGGTRWQTPSFYTKIIGVTNVRSALHSPCVQLAVDWFTFVGGCRLFREVEDGKGFLCNAEDFLCFEKLFGDFFRKEA